MMEKNIGGEIERSIVELRKTFKSGITKSYEWRKNQLQSLLKLLTEHEKDFFRVLNQDLGKSSYEAYKDEVGPVKKATEYALKNLKSWMSSKNASLAWLFFPGSGQLIPEPYGLVLIISSWNYPIDLALEPMIGAIAAGNTVVIKPSELATESSAFLAKFIPEYLDSNAVKVIEGGVAVNQQLLHQKWDKIFFTGSPRVGRIVMTEAAKNLTPVALELGAKCPIIFDFKSITSNIEVAVKRLASAKWGAYSGQACIGIDYLLVEEKFASALVALLKKIVVQFYGEENKSLKNISRTVSKKHFHRLCNLIKDPSVADTIVHGGSFDEDKLVVAPTILVDPPLDAEIMTEEIFGPILPIITLKKIEESIEFINSRPKPLALYAFTHNESFKKRIISETSSGSITFNDVIIHYICDEIPFGGVGQSGMGRYHGKYTFETFSHEKPVLRRGFFPDLDARYPPWNDYKMEFLRLSYKLDYFGLLLLILGLKRYRRGQVV